MKNNQRPTYQIPDEYKQNLAIADNMARIGLPSQQYNNQANAIGRNQAGAVSALGNSANQGGGLAQIVRAGNDANSTLNAQDAQARMGNQRYANQMRSQLGSQKLAQQQYNQFDKYSETFNRAQALRGAANQDLSNGINGATSVIGAAAMGGAFNRKPPSGQYMNQGGQWYGKDIGGGYSAMPQSLPQAQGLGYQNQFGGSSIISNYQIPGQ